MPIFKREESPSMRKMDVNKSSGGRLRSKVRKFNMSNIIGDPFSLATLGIGVGGWLIAFVSSIIADIDSQYPNFAWWSLVYMLFCIVGIFITVATDSVFTYHVAITGFVSAGLVFNTSAVNSLIYYSEGSKEAGAAGFILLSMVSIVWIFYFGSQPQASHRQAIDSFALHKDRPISRASRHMTQSYLPDTMHSAGQQPQMYNSAQLAGFETSSPVPGNPGNRYSQAQRESTAMFSPPAQAPISTLQHQQSQPALQQMPSFASGQQQQAQQQPTQQPQALQTADSSISQPTFYPYRAKAIYSYEANPDDPNEISFNKNDVLEVSDVSGRWWQAKKVNGETGIAPSNYLILL